MLTIQASQPQQKMTNKKKKIQHATSQRYLNVALSSGFIYSQFYHFGHMFRSKRAAFRDNLQRTLWTLIHCNINDNMKAARNNPAKPALCTPSSFDIYFGEDVCELFEESGDVIMERTAYANGTGSLTIGLDPRHTRIYKIFPALDRLKRIVNWAVNDHYRQKGEKFDYVFNHVSSKLYFDGKKTPPHTDIAFSYDHSSPKQHNSQMPNTPVAIITIGADKWLEFILYTGCGQGKEVDGERSIKFLQKSSSFVIMDSRDEFLDEELTFWKHASHLVNGGVCLSLMFRVAQNTVQVYKSTGHLFNPRMIGGNGSKKQQQFDTGWRKYGGAEGHAETPLYAKMKCEKMKKIQDKLGSYVARKNSVIRP